MTLFSFFSSYILEEEASNCPANFSLLARAIFQPIAHT
jgi:hypothetical protein